MFYRSAASIMTPAGRMDYPIGVPISFPRKKSAVCSNWEVPTRMFLIIKWSPLFIKLITSSIAPTNRWRRSGPRSIESIGKPTFRGSWCGQKISFFIPNKSCKSFPNVRACPSSRIIVSTHRRIRPPHLIHLIISFHPANQILRRIGSRPWPNTEVQLGGSVIISHLKNMSTCNRPWMHNS